MKRTTPTTGARRTAETAELRKHLGKEGLKGCARTAEELRKLSTSAVSLPSLILAASPPAPSLVKKPRPAKRREVAPAEIPSKEREMATTKRPTSAEDEPLLAAVRRRLIDNTAIHVLSFVVGVEMDEDADPHAQFVAGRLRLWLTGKPAAEALPRSPGRMTRELKALRLAAEVVFRKKGCNLLDAIAQVATRTGFNEHTVTKAYRNYGKEVRANLKRGLLAPPEVRNAKRRA